jgi:hypothetical protein
MSTAWVELPSASCVESSGLLSQATVVASNQPAALAHHRAFHPAEAGLTLEVRVIGMVFPPEGALNHEDVFFWIQRDGMPIRLCWVVQALS